MRTYVFTEMPYPDFPADKVDSVKVSMPSRLYNPIVGAQLYNRYLDEYASCDELGLDIMINEHHSQPTCLQTAGPLHLAILARETQSSRLLILGNPIGMRREPVRVAEEMAMVDNISFGRLDCGFVVGAPFEPAVANMNPVGKDERMWEAHDLIMKAFTSHDGPFNWEGKYFHYRQVNVWPRPYQQPHPPTWIATQRPEGTVQAAQNGHVVATFLLGFEKTKAVFDAYRNAAVESGRYASVEEVPNDRLCLMVMMYTGDTDGQALDAADELCWHFRSGKSQSQWMNPPGYFAPPRAASVWRTAFEGGNMQAANGLGPSVSPADLVEKGMMCAGNPDSVYDQIKRLYDYVGGFGHLIVMYQSGNMDHALATTSLQRYAADVHPRLSELGTLSFVE